MFGFSTMHVESSHICSYPITKFPEAERKEDSLAQKLWKVIFKYLVCFIREFCPARTVVNRDYSVLVSSDSKRDRKCFDPEIYFETILLRGCQKGDIGTVKKAIQRILKREPNFFSSRPSDGIFTPLIRAVEAVMSSGAEEAACEELLKALISLNPEMIKRAENYLFSCMILEENYRFFFHYFIEHHDFDINCERQGLPKQVIFLVIDHALREKSLDKVNAIAQCSGVDFTKKHGRCSPIEYVDELLEDSDLGPDLEGILLQIKHSLTSHELV
jgi:hypothetical protein